MHTTVFHDFNSDSIDDYLINDDNLLNTTKFSALISTIYNNIIDASLTSTTTTTAYFVFSIGCSAANDFLVCDGSIDDITDFLLRLEQQCEPPSLLLTITSAARVPSP